MNEMIFRYYRAMALIHGVPLETLNNASSTDFAAIAAAVPVTVGFEQWCQEMKTVTGHLSRKTEDAEEPMLSDDPEVQAQANADCLAAMLGSLPGRPAKPEDYLVVDPLHPPIKAAG